MQPAAQAALGAPVARDGAAAANAPVVRLTDSGRDNEALPAAVAVAPGYAGCQDPSTGGKDFCNAIIFADDPSPDVPPHNHWLLSVGVNPPLPPVPCNAVYDESACDATDRARDWRKVGPRLSSDRLPRDTRNPSETASAVRGQ